LAACFAPSITALQEISHPLRHSPPSPTIAWGEALYATPIQKSKIKNQKSKIKNQKSSIINHQSSIINHQSATSLSPPAPVAWGKAIAWGKALYATRPPSSLINR
jgi:hypothetical protein